MIYDLFIYFEILCMTVSGWLEMGIMKLEPEHVLTLEYIKIISGHQKLVKVVTCFIS